MDQTQTPEQQVPNTDQIVREGGVDYLIRVDKMAKIWGGILLGLSAVLLLGGGIVVTVMVGSCNGNAGCNADLAGVVLPYVLFVIPIGMVLFIAGIVSMASSRKKLRVVAMQTDVTQPQQTTPEK